MLPQDPQKKISGITNQPRPVTTQGLNAQTGKQPKNSSHLGPMPNQASQVKPTPSGVPPDTGDSTPPEEKKGFMAALKQKVTNSGKEYLRKKTTEKSAPASEGPTRQVDSQGTPAALPDQGIPKHDRPKPEVPKSKKAPMPKRPQMPKFNANIPKRPKIG